MSPALEQVMPVLRCPASGAALVRNGNGALVTEDGLRSYPVLGGVPVLLAVEKSLFDPARVQAAAAAKSPGQRGVASRLERLARWMLSLPPTASRSVGTQENFHALAQLLRERAEAMSGRARVLVVGGASLGVGFDELLGDSRVEVVETDVYVGPRTMIVCDGHDLPFADGSFDAVVCQAVLEHVVDPWRVAEEVWRVLAPEGYVYSEVPFMQQVHLGAFDFTRFTLLGHRRLWRYFDEIGAGAQGGPGMALIWSIQYFARAFVPRRLWAAADRLASLCFFWLKYVDDYLVRTPGGVDAASGTFFLGRRRVEPVDDRTIVRGYRGGGPRLG